MAVLWTGESGLQDEELQRRWMVNVFTATEPYPLKWLRSLNFMYTLTQTRKKSPP